MALLFCPEDGPSMFGYRVGIRVPSSSSSGPGAYAPDAPQLIGLLCDPCPPVIFRRSYFRRQVPPHPAAKGGTVGENVGW